MRRESDSGEDKSFGQNLREWETSSEDGRNLGRTLVSSLLHSFSAMQSIRLSGSHSDSGQFENQTKIFHCLTSSGAIERANERVNE